MKVTILVDNCAGTSGLAAHGLSFLVDAGKKVLFDTGPSDLVLHNAKRLDINLDEIDYIVLSHGHFDHGNGLEYLPGNKKLICHPSVFAKRYREKEGHYIGISSSREELEAKYDLLLTKEPVRVSERIIFLGEIPRLNDFEAKNTTFVDEQGNADFIPDDSGIAVLTKKGLVVISGCAHAGIVNTIEYAKLCSGIANVHAVMGGFHLKTDNNLTFRTIEYLKKEKVERVLPSHCTAYPALVKFSQVFGNKQVRVGDVYEF